MIDNKTLTDSLLSCVWATAHTPFARWSMCTYHSRLDKYISYAIQRTGCWLECDDAAWMQSILKQYAKPLLVDLGANIGFYTCAASSVGADVVAFEPSPINAMHLLHSVRRNHFENVQLNTLCVSNGTEPCILSDSLRNMGAFRPIIGRDHRVRTFQHFQTVSIALDFLLPPQHRPTFLKMDIEGRECMAFQGMQRLLNESTNIVGALVEFDKSVRCCEDLTRPQTGAFWILHAKHSLCAYQAPAARPVYTQHTPLNDLCAISTRGRQLNLRWERCKDRNERMEASVSIRSM